MEQAPHVDFYVDIPGQKNPSVYGTLSPEFTYQHHIHTLPDEGVVQWKRFDVPLLYLSPEWALLMVQGLSLFNLFPETASIVWTQGSVGMRFPGWLLPLAGSYQPFDAPPCIRNVILACVESAPPNMTKEELVGFLISHVAG